MMDGRRLRAGALTLGLGLLTTLVVAVPSAAARARCQGKAVTIMGTKRADTLRGTRGPDVISGRGGIDTIRGLGGDDTICGGAGRDSIYGGGGDDSVEAGRGTDSIWPGGGNDTVDGQANGPGGQDDVRFSLSKNGVTASLVTGRASGEGRDRLKNVEQLVGSDHDDELTGSDGPNVVMGLGGDDVIRGLGENDVVAGNGGNDTIEGGQGEFDYLDNHYLATEFGETVSSDPINVDLAAQTLTGQGTDTISGIESAGGTPGDDTALGNEEANDLVGFNDGDDTLSGAGGEDIIDGGDGSDTLDGGGDFDILGHLDSTVGVTVDLQAGTSEGMGTDSVTGFEEAWGSYLDDVLRGSAQADRLDGWPGDDTLDGRAGDDTLVGGMGLVGEVTDEGNDTADGGAGTDICVAEAETNCEAEFPEPAGSLRTTASQTYRAVRT